jgi:hypothetical protein
VSRSRPFRFGTAADSTNRNNQKYAPFFKPTHPFHNFCLATVTLLAFAFLPPVSLFASDDYTKMPIGDLRHAAEGGDAIAAYQLGLLKIENFQFA